MFVPDDPAPADAAVLLGSTSWRRCVDAGVALYASGAVGALLVTGGFNHRLQACEAHVMRAAALVAGVPDGDILMDDQARNTRENVVNALELLAARFGADGLVRLKIVAIAYHMRRALLTAREASQRRIALTSLSYPSVHYGRDDWTASDVGRRDILQEIGKIARYLPSTPEAAVLADLARRSGFGVPTDRPG